jgi:hypothetical protein
LLDFWEWEWQSTLMELPELQAQEIPYDHPDSRYMFVPSERKPFFATPRAIELYRLETITACMATIQMKAILHNGLDYLQVFVDPDKSENLWIIEDGEGGSITALLPSDY